mmetsp:Transcript_46010/g.109731  ORF Transcript_46010/g.109731 Transcript_46010/m.109731 type:complete len:217 (+) Transcript_46010:203-853(+)
MIVWDTRKKPTHSKMPEALFCTIASAGTSCALGAGGGAPSSSTIALSLLIDLGVRIRVDLVLGFEDVVHRGVHKLDHHAQQLRFKPPHHRCRSEPLLQPHCKRDAARLFYSHEYRQNRPMRDVPRRGAVVASCSPIRPRRQKLLNHRRMTSVRSVMQRRLSPLVLRVRGGPRRQKLLYHRRMTFFRSEMQRHFSIPVFDGHVSSARDQLPHLGRVP